MGDFYNGGLWGIFSYRHDVTKVGDFYNGGLRGNFSMFVRFSLNFVSDNIKKTLTLTMDVSARNKK